MLLSTLCHKCEAELWFQAKDAGGSMTIHTFGAYFGLMVTRVLFRPNLDKSKHRNSSVYHSDLFAMIGKHLAQLDRSCVNLHVLPSSGRYM